MVCFSRLILVALAFSLQSIEHTVDEAWAFFGAELPGQIDGLGNHNLPLLGGLGHLLRGEAQDGTVQDRLAVQWPVGTQRIEFIIQGSTAFPCPQREIDALGSVGFGGRTASPAAAVKLSGAGSPPRSKMYRACKAARRQSLATLIATPPWWTRPRSRQPWPRNPCCLGCRRAPGFGLGKGVGGDHPEPDGFVGFDGQLGAALRDGVGDHLIMDGLTFDDAAQDRNPVKPFLEKGGRQDRQLKSTWGGEF